MADMNSRFQKCLKYAENEDSYYLMRIWRYHSYELEFSHDKNAEVYYE